MTATHPVPDVAPAPSPALERRHWLAALAMLFVLFAPYQTLVQTVLTDDALRKGVEADDYDMTWVTVAYGVGIFTVYAWFLSTLPAYAPLMPSAVETAAALALTVAYATAGGATARWLADRLVGDAPELLPALERSVAGATSPGR